MKDYKYYIDSGLLDLYVMGQTTPEESQAIEQIAVSDPDFRKEISTIERSLENYAKIHEVEPNPLIRPFLMATIDFSDRMQSGEMLSFPPVLNESSKIDDFSEWLNREDMILPEQFDDVYAKILSYSPQIITAIVWIKEMAPQEVHDHEFEKFLIVEGTCDITIENSVYQLVPGDYLSIPLYKSHFVTVTSEIPCKVILQRVVA